MKNYPQFILENKNISGPIYIEKLNITLKLYINQKENETIVKLMSGDKLYKTLSIRTTDTKNLDKNEFFINPEIDKNIIDELIKQFFIKPTGITSDFGNKPTVSYFINFS